MKGAHSEKNLRSDGESRCEWFYIETQNPRKMHLLKPKEYLN